MTRRNRRKPGLAEAALNDAARRGRSAALAFGLVSRASRLGVGIALAVLAGGLVMNGMLLLPAAFALFGLLAASAVSGIAAERAAGRAEAAAGDAAISLMERFYARAAIREVGVHDPGDLTGRLARQPSAAAAAMVTVKNARTLMAAGPFMAAAAIAFFSWQAALLLLLGMPVMIMFFVLIGGLTKARAARQEEALSRLSAVFAERIRCLPTILACHAEGREEERLGDALVIYKRKATDVLQVAFLNAGVLDFFSSLSVAMLAIFLGLGHLGLADVPGFAGLTLTQSLAILVLAPEFFQPVRRYAELYHQAAEGKAALAALEPLAAARVKRDPRLPGGRVAARGLVLHHIGAMPDLDLPATGLVAITGPSGCGKTSLLRALAGVDAPVSGQVFTDSRSKAWCAADAWLPGGTLGEIAGGEERPCRALAPAIALGLMDDPRFKDGLRTRIAEGGADLSGGQRLRVSLARAACRDAGLILADEPTAKLDEATARRIRRTLTRLSGDRLVVVATHDPALARLAVTEIALAPKLKEDA